MKGVRRAFSPEIYMHITRKKGENMGKRIKTLAGLFVFLAGSAGLFGQVTTATIQGTAEDEQGAVIPGVDITITNMETGVSRTSISDDEGRYLATNLNLGTYEVRAELMGFRAAVRQGITLTIGQVAVVDLTLQVGEISEEVIVTGDAALVETTQSSLSAIVDQRQIRDLPLNVRSYSELAALQVGVHKMRGLSGSMNGFGQQLSFAGSRQDSNAYLLDGADINNPYNKAPNSGTGGILGVEAIREFQVLTNTYSAQYGRSMGGQLLAVTRSGTNTFHGSIYEFHRNDNLDARNFFDGSQKPEFKRNQFGFSLGGPIVEDKTFVFGNYEGFREDLGLTRRGTTISENARLGIIDNPDVAGVPQAPTIVTVDPAVQPYLDNLDLFPLPNGADFGDGTAELIFENTQTINEDSIMTRVDHNFSDSDSGFFRISFNDGDRLSPGNQRAEIGRELIQVRNYFTTMEEKHIFSPSTLNTAKFSYNRQEYTIFDIKEVEIPSSLWLTGPTSDAIEGQQEMGAISITGGGGFGGGISFYPRFFHLNVFEWTDDVSHTVGSHSLKFGVLAKRIQYNFRSDLRLKGSYALRGVEEFLTGAPSRNFRVQHPGSDGYRGIRLNLFALYIQDDYKVRPNLTLNLGLRYEFITVPTEVNGKVANLQDRLDPLIKEGDPFFQNPSLKNFSPRIGFAWDPLGNGKTSLRGGYGIYYHQVLYNYWNHAYYSQPPYLLAAFISGAQWPNAIDEVIAAPSDSFAISLESIQGKFTNPYIQQWNLSFERELFPQTALKIGYVGSRGAHLGRIIDNVQFSTTEGHADGRRFVPEALRGQRPNTANICDICGPLSEVRQRTMDANSFYHGLVLSFKKRYSEGFNMQISYTFSRSIDDASGLIGKAETPTTSQWSAVPEDPSFDRGLSLHHIQNNFVFNSSWDIPFAKGLSGLGGAILDGWTINSIVNLADGIPGSPELGFNPVLNGASGNRGFRPDLAPGRSNNPVTGSVENWYDATAFVLPPLNESGPGRVYGNLGRMTVIGPGIATLDLSFFKNNFIPSIAEDFNIQFRAEFFNILNHTNLGHPSFSRVINSSGVPSPTAGRITSTNTTSRNIQLAIKLLW